MASSSTTIPQPVLIEHDVRDWLPWVASVGVHAAFGLVIAVGLWEPEGLLIARPGPRILEVSLSSPAPARARSNPIRKAKTNPVASRPAAPTSEAARRIEESSAAADSRTPSIPSGNGAPDNYYSQIYREIERHKRYPRQALARGLEGRILVEFTIQPDGRIENVTVKEPSEHVLLNDAAVDLLERIRKVSAPPEGVATALRLKLPIIYSLR